MDAVVDRFILIKWEIRTPILSSTHTKMAIAFHNKTRILLFKIKVQCHFQKARKNHYLSDCPLHGGYNVYSSLLI
jgi:hypothetical protein